MEIILFFAILLVSPIIGGIYSFIGEGKKRELRLGMKDKVVGIGKWYSQSLTSWRNLFLYFWVFAGVANTIPVLSGESAYAIIEV